MYGCTDSNAPNYNASAEIDDGTCKPPIVRGCTHPGAANYNWQA